MSSYLTDLVPHALALRSHGIDRNLTGLYREVLREEYQIRGLTLHDRTKTRSFTR